MPDGRMRRMLDGGMRSMPNNRMIMTLDGRMRRMPDGRMRSMPNESMIITLDGRIRMKMPEKMSSRLDDDEKTRSYCRMSRSPLDEDGKDARR